MEAAADQTMSSTDDSSAPPARDAPDTVSLLPSIDRLSLPFILRFPGIIGAASFSGLILGLAHGSNEAGLRFRAENAHRLPKTQTGWFLYHKSKNYHAMLGGTKEGFRMGGRLGLWAGIFSAAEEGVDRGRAAFVRAYRRVAKERHAARGWEGEDHEVQEVMAGNRDFISTMLAGVGTAGLFSAWHRFPLATAERLAKRGLKIGFLYGLAQDAASLLRGRRLGYVEFLKRHSFGTDTGDAREAAIVPAG